MQMKIILKGMIRFIIQREPFIMILIFRRLRRGDEFTKVLNRRKLF